MGTKFSPKTKERCLATKRRWVRLARGSHWVEAYLSFCSSSCRWRRRGKIALGRRTASTTTKWTTRKATALTSLALSLPSRSSSPSLASYSLPLVCAREECWPSVRLSVCWEHSLHASSPSGTTSQSCQLVTRQTATDLAWEQRDGQGGSLSRFLHHLDFRRVCLLWLLRLK